MRFCRFDDERLGLVDGDSVAMSLPHSTSCRLLVSAAAARRVHRQSRGGGGARPAIGADARRCCHSSSVTLLSPVANPGKIIAAPVNYQKHLDEVRDNPQLHGNNPGHTFTIHSGRVCF